MFIGHFAVGFAAKRFAPKVSLGTLFLGCQLADLVWPTLVLFAARGGNPSFLSPSSRSPSARRLVSIVRVISASE